MKKTITPLKHLAAYVICATLIFNYSSCKRDRQNTRTYHTKIPVMMQTADLRAMDISAIEPVKLGFPGKIYVYGNYLFINETGNGIHIVENSDPSNPRIIKFIKIPGNVDMAVNNNMLYADCYVDLLVFDISNPNSPKLIKRLPDVYPGLYIDQAKKTFLSYKDTVITEVVYDNDRLVFDSQVNPSLNSAAYGQGYGQGGSMARFTLLNGHLYTVNDYELSLFDVSVPSQPKFINTIPLGWGIETIFPYGDNLFIGSSTGMHIYDAKEPSMPKHLSTYSHVNSCDPVVVNGKYAFVTLRSENFCRQGVNELHVLNIEDLKNPKLLHNYPMQNPHGLGTTAKELYLCEGDYGFKKFDISDVSKIDKRLLQHFKTLKATDVIPAQKSLIVTGREGIYQFDYSMRKLSIISIAKPLN